MYKLFSMQKVLEKETIVPVRFDRSELKKIDEAVNRIGAKSRSAFIREATEKYLQEVGALKIIEIRQNVSPEEAKTDILDYLKKHKEAETFDIANDLRFDLEFTVRILKQLWEEGKVN